jgi:hypothetical protein
MRTAFLFLSACLASGCAAVDPHYARSDDSEYQREDSRLEAVEHFEQLRERCDRAGGTVYIDRQSGGRFPPATLEMRSATCGHRIGSAQTW